MKFNKYILLAFIAICVLFVTLNASRKEVIADNYGLRPGMAHSHVSLGRPMWVA